MWAVAGNANAGVDGIGFGYRSTMNCQAPSLLPTVPESTLAIINEWLLCQRKQWRCLAGLCFFLFPSHKTPFTGGKILSGKIHSGSCWWLPG